MMMDFEEVHRQIGQIDGLEFTRRVVDVAIAQIFENLRNSGKYKGLPYKDADGNTRRVVTLEEFCEVKLGKSYNRCGELARNLRLLGPELYEQSERLGLRNIDQMEKARTVESDPRPWVGEQYVDAQGNAWKRLNLKHLLSQPDFLEIGLG